MSRELLPSSWCILLIRRNGEYLFYLNSLQTGPTGHCPFLFARNRSEYISLSSGSRLPSCSTFATGLIHSKLRNRIENVLPGKVTVLPDHRLDATFVLNAYEGLLISI